MSVEAEIGRSASNAPSPEGSSAFEVFGVSRLFWRIPEAVVVAEAKTGRIVLWNPSAERLFGYTASEALQLTIDVLVPDHLRSSHRDGRSHYAATLLGPLIDRNAHVELPALRRNGEQFFIELSLSPLDDASVEGRFVLALIRDVSDRKRAEDEHARRILEEAARAEAEALAEISRRISANLDLDRVLQTVVESALRLVDASLSYMLLPDAQGTLCVAALVGNRTDRLGGLVIPPRTDIAARVIGKGRPFQVQDYRRRTAFVHDADVDESMAAEGVVSGLGLPIFRGAETTGVLCIGSRERRRFTAGEIGKLERLAQQAAVAIENSHALAQAREAIRLREEFLVLASHELRTPLTVLKGNLQLAERRARRGEASDAVASLVSRADMQADRLAALVRTLLDASRFDGGQIGIRREPVALGALVNRVVRTAGDADPQREFVVKLPPRLPAIEADSERLEQVLVSLVENARKFSAPDAPITVAIEVTRQSVVIAVRDSGIGILPEDQARIFSRFHRGANVTPNHSGLGLGLYLASKIVHAHGGRLAVESAPNKGSTFTMTLPR
ncbi:MAG: ATP-binding protein [Dehalococcoidia bacterium]